MCHCNKGCSTVRQQIKKASRSVPWARLRSDTALLCQHVVLRTACCMPCPSPFAAHCIYVLYHIAITLMRLSLNE